MALGETEQAQKLARAALALQPDLTTKYVREQEWYRDEAVLEKLRRATYRSRNSKTPAKLRTSMMTAVQNRNRL